MPTPTILPYVAGPTDWAWSTGPDGAYEYVGFCAGEVHVSLSADYQDVKADVGGSRMPIDELFLGEVVYLSGEIILTDERVIERALRRLKNTVPGAGGPGSIGTLMGLEGQYLITAIRCRYADVPAYADAGMRPGYRFVRSRLDRATDVGLSTDEKRFKLTVKCLPEINTEDGSYLVYDSDLTGFPVPVPAPLPE